MRNQQAAGQGQPSAGEAQAKPSGRSGHCRQTKVAKPIDGTAQGKRSGQNSKPGASRDSYQGVEDAKPGDEERKRYDDGRKGVGGGRTTQLGHGEQ